MSKLINKNNLEKFEDPDPIYPFIGIDNDNRSKIVFYHPNIKEGSKYLKFSSPDNFTITQYLYEDGLLIILTSNNKIYYCNNCNLFNNNVIWNNLIMTNQGTITRIALDRQLGDKLFVLNSQGQVHVCNNILYNRIWNQINLPAEDLTFKYIDSNNGLFAGIGTYTNFVYYVDVSLVSQNPVPWVILDKTKMINQIKITPYGFFGKTNDNDLYLCKVPCDGNAEEKWRLINSSINSSINSNSEIISIIKDNSLFTCNNTCSSNSLNQLTFNNKINLFSGSVIDYKFPIIVKVPEVPPVDNSILTKITNSMNKDKNTYSSIQDQINDINKKTIQLNEIEKLLSNNLQISQQERDNIIKSLMNNLGLEVQPPLGTPVSETFYNLPKTKSEFGYMNIQKNNLLAETKKKINFIDRNKGKEKKEIKVDNLIITLPKVS